MGQCLGTNAEELVEDVDMDVLDFLEGGHTDDDIEEEDTETATHKTEYTNSKEPGAQA